ncbi:MAG: hypothetical protein K0R17_663 [Rariglobus sp.]|jgi:autotransporter-associated beta strand protein|nr:hypothetical protein [Rariglobus sp.]
MIPQKRIHLFRTAILGAAVVSLPGFAFAATLYWDGGNAGWDAVASWTTDAAATTPDPVSVPGSGDDVWFNRDAINTASTVSLNASQAANSLTFRSTGTTVLQGGGTNQTLTIGAGGINKTGTGAVTIGSATSGQNVAIIFGGNQTWTNGNATGALTINNGVTGTASATQTLTIDGAGNTSIAGGIANGSGGTVSLIKDGAGTLSLRTASTYSGTTTLNAGTINNGGVTTSITSAAGTGQLIINGGTIANSASTGNGSFSLANTSQTWGGDFSLSTGGSASNSLTLGAAAANTITLTGNRIVSVAGSGNTARININGVIGDGGNGYGLTWAGTGNVRVTLGGTASTYSGTTTVEAGWLQFATSVANGANSAFGNSTTAVRLGATTGSAPAGILATANATFARDITLQSGGTGSLVIGGTVFSGGDTGGSMTNTGTITLGTGTTGRNVTLHRGTFSGNIVDPAGLVSSAGVVTISAFRTINGNTESSTTTTLSGNNTFSGGVNLTNDGNGTSGSTVTLRLNSATALGTGTLTIGSALADRNVALDSSAASALTLTTNNAQVWNGDFAWTGTQALNMGTGSVSLGTSAGATRIITTNGANALSIGGVISDGTNGTTPTINLTKAGTGTLILYGNSSYTGATTISAGTLQIGNGGTTGSLATSSVTNNGSLVFNRSDAGMILNAVISGTGAVIQSGSGRTTLTGASTYTGATTVNAGTLIVNGSLASGSAVTVNSGGTLGGSGTIGGTTTLAAGSRLSAGSDSAATLTFSGSLNISAAANDTAAFVFELGTAFDKIVASSLTLGTDVLDAADFDFTTGTGFAGSQTYTLFDSGSITGSFLSFVVTNIGGSGINGTVSLVDNDVILTTSAVPEPSTYAILLGGAAVAFAMLRRTRSGQVGTSKETLRS